MVFFLPAQQQQLKSADIHICVIIESAVIRRRSCSGNINSRPEDFPQHCMWSENNPEWAAMSCSAFNVSRWYMCLLWAFCTFATIINLLLPTKRLLCCLLHKHVTTKPEQISFLEAHVAIRRSMTLKVCCGISTNMLAVGPLSPLSCEAGLHGPDSFELQQLAFDLYVHQWACRPETTTRAADLETLWPSRACLMGVITSNQLVYVCIVSNTEKHAVMTQDQRLYVKGGHRHDATLVTVALIPVCWVKILLCSKINACQVNAPPEEPHQWKQNKWQLNERNRVHLRSYSRQLLF